jgi:hypothetical protein
MPDFVVKARKTSPEVITTVTALTREDAVLQVVQAAAEGEEIEVFDAKELPAGATGGAGATGPTGTTGASGPTGTR